MDFWPRRIRHVNARNLSTLYHASWVKLSGSLGDLGTLLLLMIALAAPGSIDLASTLVVSGLFNIVTGIMFGIPLPVQPMNAIASAAILGRHDAPMAVVVAAGQWVGADVLRSLLLMSATGLLRWATSVVPIPVVKGIQLGTRLSLFIEAGSSLPRLDWFHPSSHRLPWVHVWSPRFVWPRWTGARDSSALWMSIGQLPLTTLNSALAVNALAADLLPEAHIPSLTAIEMSVAVMNLSGTWSGAMPLCHGAGGLASSCSVLFRGAKRSGASVIVWDW
ncbi:hypothetical protein E4U23_008130 [Claviceps purpurea]|nr:hypothetical protein E4U23_008130 [Claviceps purpurea]